MSSSGARLARRSSLAALAIACALAPAGAEAISTPPGDSALSPRLAELSRPAIRSAPRPEQAARLGLAANGPGSLLRSGGRVLVDVRFDHGAAGLDALRAAGGRIISVSREYQTVTVAVAPASLRSLAGVPGVELVSENREPLLYGVGESPSTAAVGTTCEGGAVVSEGVAQLRAAIARSKHDLSGSGVTVGVLSDSFDQATEAEDGSGPVATHAGEDVASGDLPGAANSCAGQGSPVDVLEDFAPSEGQATDEGRAMLQIVHDVAPRASLAFATAFHSETSFAENIERLARPVAEGGAGANVIVDDVSWFEEPFFQDGPIADAVDKVTAAGVVYFSSAGNNNLLDSQGHEIASWEAPHFRDAETCPASVQALNAAEFNGTHCMNFKPGGGTDTTFGIKVSAGATLTADLQWDEPWYGVNTDLDAFLLDSKEEIVSSSVEANAGNPAEGATQRPVEVLQWKNSGASAQTVRLVVNRFSGGNPRLKLALLQNGGGVTETEYPTSSGEDVVGPTIFGHNGAAGAVSVGAINYQTSAQPERYSSRGPVTHYFGPVDGTTAAAPLSSAESISKPDLVATDCGATTFFAELEGEWRFCGTSAAAPHAAGVAALELQAQPGATVAEIREAQTATASPISGFGAGAVGAGLLNADAAVASLLPASAVTITEFPPSRTSDDTPTFGFSSSSLETAGFECAIDAALPQPCTSPYTAPAALADGPHVFAVLARSASSVKLGEASYAFTTDTTPPAITFSRRPPAQTSQRLPSFGFAAGEPAGFSCGLDGSPPQPCTSPYTVPAALADGPHSFEVTATDQVGNVGHGSAAFNVDTVAPSVTFTSQPAPTSAGSIPVFGFEASKPATFTCSVDGAHPQPCGSPFAVPSPLADGPHALEVTATDAAGNAGHATAAFAVDTRPPQTSFAAHPPSVIRTRQPRPLVSFRFRSDESGASFLCKIDRGPLRTCRSRISRRFEVGRHGVEVRARDAAGNVDPTPAVFRFRVKRVG